MLNIFGRKNFLTITSNTNMIGKIHDNVGNDLKTNKTKTIIICKIVNKFLFDDRTPLAYCMCGEYFKGIKSNFIRSYNCVPDNETIPKYKNIPNKTGTGIKIRTDLICRHKPIAKCTKKPRIKLIKKISQYICNLFVLPVTLCSLTKTSLGFSPGINELENTVKLAQ